MRFCANVTLLFTEMPMLQRFSAAKRAGFDGVEILFPYDLTVKDISRAALTAGTDVVLINCPPPNWAGGPRGFAAEPDRIERFRRDFDRSLRVAEALRVRHIHIMAGRAEGDAARDCMIENLRWATARAPHASLTIEPINRDTMPGYFLCDYDQAAGIIDQVGAQNLSLQFDTFHAHAITGDVLSTFAAHRPLIRHIQIGSFPARAEPGPGPIDFPGFFQAVRASDYRGWISAEYNPTGMTSDGLGWLAEERRDGTGEAAS
ncbi:TIM barrel protein [Paracoccus sp. TK19116]|uniref:TIM barrel protein n=1 Tax=Paracoccus albicereus TaxID=2922394 RepID=A0ABT1MNU7_9RHOB|nr:TIM barrel protein [Paracoccus albicereus]MCQ0969851.1 TIM barrel protein [Paracoccus albicereus]